MCLAPRGQRDENSRAKRENLKKQKNRKEYDIGWRMDSVPKNTTLAVQMGCPAPPQGLCCLVLDETSRTVKVAATLEPSAAINLEYLLLVTWYQLVGPCGAMWCPCPPHRSTSIEGLRNGSHCFRWTRWTLRTWRRLRRRRSMNPVGWLAPVLETSCSRLTTS